MKWGILATGTIASKFADTINRMKEAGEDQELTACASRTIEKAEAFAVNHEIEKAYGSYKQLSEDPEVQIIYIATPNNLHYENCRMCLLAGKHVLCEKPFTVHRNEAEELFALAEEKGLFLMEGFWIRHLPALIKMRELIQGGEIGDVIWARSEYGFIASGARRVRKFAPELDGGAMLDIGIYNLGFMRMVMGDVQPERFSSEYHRSEFGTDDFSSVLLTYPGGRTACVTTAIGLELPRHAVIYGTGGSIRLEDFQFAETLYVNPQNKESYQMSFPIRMGGFEYEIREAKRCITSGKTTSDILKKEDTLDILELMEDIMESWKQTINI